MTALVERVVFSTPRTAEFVELRALQSQTGQPVAAFGSVVIKELLDNALDAAETAGVAPNITISATVDGDIQRVTVSDNGCGISADTVARICDFSNTVSDKARYRGPARGAQGNAFKTLLGIPFALGVEAPVVIVSQGVRHEIRVVVDPVGDVIIAQEQTANFHNNIIQIRAGTSVSVPLPIEVDANVKRWAYKAALVNPHATITVGNHAYSDERTDPKIYESTGERWSKWTPSQPSNPHWYDRAAFSALVHSHIRETARTGVDMPLGKFIAEFDGLTATAKQKQVRAAAAGVTHLSGLQGRDDEIAALHDAMMGIAKPTNPARLGPIGKAHLERLLDDQFGIYYSRFWYKAATVVDAGVPWVIEVAVADTHEAGGIWFGCNHAPAFGDPLGRADLRCDDIRSTGAASFLQQSGITYEQGTAVVHVICAATEFVDKGKVALVVPAAVAVAAADALTAATKVIRREEDQRRKDATKAARALRRARDHAARAERAEQWTQKDAVFHVIPEAKRRAGQVVSARTLFYKVRPLVQNYLDKELQFGYFSQTLLPEYERTVGPIPGLYYEPRGELHHPHDGKVTPLGTREVENYQLPPHQFDKILYIEKMGLQAQLAPYRLAEKYDMAIIYGQGYAATACRNLLASSAVRDMQIFVLHDADIDGYNIARTLAESTKRMPDHNIEVIDLGLTVPQAIAYELETEQFTRVSALPSDLYLEPEALQWFTGTPFAAGNGKTHYSATRCELNAFSSDGLAEFIEDRLREHGATTKLQPPRKVLQSHTAARRHELLVDRVKAELDRAIDAVAGALAEQVDIDGIDADSITDKFDTDPFMSWRGAVTALLDTAIDQADITDRIVALVAEQLGGDQ